MARTIYSRQLYAAVFTGTGAFVTLYTVPASTTAVIKSLFMTPGAAPNTLVPAINSAIGLGTFGPAAAGVPIIVFPSMVLKTGQTFAAFAPAGQVWSIIVSGYELVA